MFFISCLVGGIYLFYRLTKAQQMDFAFRYAIPTVIVIWSCIETLVKWKIFSEPWITLNPLFLTVVMLVFVGVLFLIVRAERKSKLSQ
jgi:cbb3-type cytochrome oxidase subunit 3